ncbi:MAG TPA: hypothetical protein VFR49_12375, partial [Solirubrobacteraceae bacterium]|nr:hypothetical protein [Solirubrobacteraceae bacterium]
FEETLPTGQGAFAVRDTAEAVEAIAAVRGDYGRHSRAARALALAYFDAEPLLARMLAEAGLPPRGPS